MRPLLTVALIPARGGSKRIRGKNIKSLGGHPLLAYSINAARGAGIQPYVSTDDDLTAEIAMRYGAEVLMRPDDIAGDDAPDILWVKHALEHIACDVFALLRPTSPFRTTQTILRALERFFDVQPDSLRAVEAVRQHPAKMWVIREDGRSPTQWMTPVADLLFDAPADGTPLHSRPSQTLPEVYVQNASLEISWRATVENTGTISGTRITPFYTMELEGLDLNTEDDWIRAERFQFILPKIGEEKVA